MEVPLKAEVITTLWGFPITNSWLCSLVVTLLLALFFISIRTTGYRLASLLYTAWEGIIEGVYDLISGIIGHHRLLPKITLVVSAFFFFLFFNNWLGLFPGVGSVGFLEPAHHLTTAPEDAHAVAVEHTPALPIENPPAHSAISESGESVSSAHAEASSQSQTVFVPYLRSANSDLNMTIAMALLSVFFIQLIGIQGLGWRAYLGKFINFSSPIFFFVGLLEMVSESVRILSFSLRLFGNIFAGEVLLTTMYNLFPYLAPIPFLGLEFFTAFMQSLIFIMLTVVFIKTSLAHESH